MPLTSIRLNEAVAQTSPRETFSQSLAKANTAPASSDEDLLREVVRGNERALAELFDRYAGMLCGIAWRVLRDGDASEDAVQSTFVRLWRDAGKFTGDVCIAGWLALTTREFAVAALQGTSGRPHGLVGVKLGTERTLPFASRIERARSGLHELPRAVRKTLEMAFFDGLAPDEIARVTATTPGEVSAALRSSLLRLRMVVQV